jgi:hypothetical protein
MTEEKYFVVHSHDEIGKDTVKFTKRTRDTAKPFSYTKDEVIMLVEYGYTLLNWQLWYEQHNKYSVGDLFEDFNGKQFIITDVKYPLGLAGSFYYNTHYVENDKLVNEGDLGGFWGECVIDMSKKIGSRCDLLPTKTTKPTPPEFVSLFDDQAFENQDDCENCHLETENE